MGISVSFDAWSGGSGAFGDWRSALFDAAYGGGPRERYEYLRKDVWHSVDFVSDAALVALLTRSDNGDDGPIAAADTLPLAARLADLLPRLQAPYREWTEQFIAGLGRAHVMGEGVEFR